jgi:hypothetical protein
VISSDYPGAVRQALCRNTLAAHQFWLTGCAGDIDPTIRRELGENTTQHDVENVGVEIGHHAVNLYRQIATHGDGLRSFSTEITVPIDTDFELVPKRELAAYRDIQRIPSKNELEVLSRWLAYVAPIVNENPAEIISIPMTVIAIGNLVFAGFGAEIYNATGLAIETAHPTLEIVTMMNVNEHQGYVPTAEEYDTNAYAARSSAFIFGRRPLTVNSENVLRADASRAIMRLMES